MSGDAQSGTAVRIGFWAAVLTAVLTVVSFALALGTPPRSGPSCAFESCVGYPYVDIAAYFPRDYLWMVPATAVAFVFLVLIVAIHHHAVERTRTFTFVGCCLATISAAFLSLDYFVQLTVVQPSVLRGETDGLSLISQYNPHGLFIALEALGYLLMSAALASVAPAFTGANWAERVLRWTFLGALVLSLVGLVALTAIYGHDLEYRFEIAVISINWSALIVGSVAAAMHFRRLTQAAASQAVEDSR